jgi:peptidoglycan hydrolase-like protein with peptidoglycan-binding domain
MINHPRRRITLAAGALAATALIAVALALTVVLRSSGATRARSVPTATARVIRTNVIERQQVTGTLGYQGNFTVTNSGAAGVVTWLPSGGAIIRRGSPLLEINRQPVRLLYGRRPADRDFAFGTSNGPDVRELQANLLALGFTAGAALQVNGRFDLATLASVEQWQRSLGAQVTGTIPLGSVAFLPGPVRIGAAATSVGATVQTGASILTATATAPAVLLQLDPGSVTQLLSGDRVLVTMPDNTTAPGRVATIGRVATTPNSDAQSGGQGPPTPTIQVTVDLLDPPRQHVLDQAPVQVAITVQEDRGVLAVPISALLAQPGGGYAIQVDSSRYQRLLPVTTGLFDDVAGRVEVTGPGLEAGMRVEVPTQ